MGITFCQWQEFPAERICQGSKLVQYRQFSLIMYIKTKKSIDHCLSVIALIILMPLFAFISIAIILDSKGPVLFKQDRIGYKGKVFKILKFRSMRIDSEKHGVYVTKKDARVTRIGKILRATSIDELPQLINILKGEMAIIGPRPTLTYHPWPYEGYSKEQKLRFDVRPGITGLAQVNGRKTVMWNQRIEYDIEYVNNMSFNLDMKIFVLTIKHIILMKNNVNTKRTL